MDYQKPLQKESVKYNAQVHLAGTEKIKGMKRTFDLLSGAKSRQGQKRETEAIRVASTPADRRALTGLALMRWQCQLEKPLSLLQHRQVVCLLGGTCSMYADQYGTTWISLGSFENGALMCGPLRLVADKIWAPRGDMELKWAFLTEVFDPRDELADENPIVAPWKGIYSASHVSASYGVCRRETGRAHLVQYMFKAFVKVTSTELFHVMKSLRINRKPVGKYPSSSFEAMVYTTICSVFPDASVDENLATGKAYLAAMKPGSKDPLDNDLDTLDVLRHLDEDTRNMKI